MTREDAATAIREIASARAASPALAKAMTRAPLRSVYSLCLRSEMAEADLGQLKEAAFTLDQMQATTGLDRTEEW